MLKREELLAETDGKPILKGILPIKNACEAHAIVELNGAGQTAWSVLGKR